MKLKFAAILAMCVMPTTASAFFLDGNSVYGAATGNNEMDRNASALYLMGVADSIQSLMPNVVCIPGNVTGQQVNDIVIRYLGANPESRHAPASDVAVLAISLSFPCSQAEPL